MVQGADYLRELGYSEEQISSLRPNTTVEFHPERGGYVIREPGRFQPEIPSWLKVQGFGSQHAMLVMPSSFSKTSLTQGYYQHVGTGEHQGAIPPGADPGQYEYVSTEMDILPSEVPAFVRGGSASVEAERAVPMVTYEYPVGFGGAGVPNGKPSGLTLSVMTPQGLRPSFAPPAGAKEVKFGRKPLALAEGMENLSFLTPNEITATGIVRETPASSRLRFERTAEVLKSEWDAFSAKHPGKDVSQEVYEQEYLPLKEKTDWFREKNKDLIFAYETLAGGEYVIGAQQTYPTIERQPLVSPYSPFVPSTQLSFAELGIEYTEFVKRLEGGLIGTTLTQEERELHRQKRKEISEELGKLPYAGIPEGVMKELIPLEFSALIGYGGVSALASKGLVGLGTYGLTTGAGFVGYEATKIAARPALEFIAPGREEWRYEIATEALGFAGGITAAKAMTIPVKAIESKVLAGKFVPEPYGELFYIGRDKELNYIFEGKVSLAPARKDLISRIVWGKGKTEKVKFVYNVEAKAGQDLPMDYLKPIGLKFKSVVSPSFEKFGEPVFEAESWVSFKPSKAMEPYFVSGETFGGQVRTYLKVPKVVGIGALEAGGIPEDYWLRFEPQMKISQTVGKIKMGKKVVEFGQFGQPDLSKFRVGYSKTRLQFEPVVPVKGSVLEQVKGMKFLDQLAKKHDVSKEAFERYLNEITYKEVYKLPARLNQRAGGVFEILGIKQTMFMNIPKIQKMALRRGISYEEGLMRVISHETSHVIDKLTAKLPEFRNLPYALQPTEIRAFAFMSEAQLGKAFSKPFEGQKFLERYSAKYPAMIQGEILKGGKGKYSGVIDIDLAATRIETRGIKFAGAGKFTGLFEFEKGMFKKVKFKPSTLNLIVAEPLKKTTIANIERLTQASGKSVQKMLVAQNQKVQKMAAFVEESQKAFFALPEQISIQAKKILLTQPKQRYLAAVPTARKTVSAYSVKTISFGKIGLPTMEKEAMPIRPTERIESIPKSVIGEEIVFGERIKPTEMLKEESIEQLVERLMPSETLKSIERMAEGERLKPAERIVVSPRIGIGERLRIGERIKLGERFRRGERFKFADLIPIVTTPPPLPVWFPLPPTDVVTSRMAKKLGKGFDVFAKVKGKFQKLNKLPLVKESALGIGSAYVEKEPAATFKLVPTKEAGFKMLGAPRFQAERFRPPIKKGRPVFGTGKFIEKTKYRINLPGEYRGITEKGLAALRQRAAFGLRLPRLKKKGKKKR